MKWISVEKAKANFENLYLIKSETIDQPELAHLKQTTKTNKGVALTFITDSGHDRENVTHIAIVSNPIE